jgi:transcriptional regulator with XRE-family HTH domain
MIDLLVSARKDAGVTQAVLAKRLGKRQSLVAKIENRERRIDVVEFITITHAIGVDPCKVLREIEAEISRSADDPSTHTVENI